MQQFVQKFKHETSKFITEKQCSISHFVYFSYIVNSSDI